jgi:AcrR family transcriptional regulator
MGARIEIRPVGRPRSDEATGAILSAMLRLLAERGFHGASTGALAAAARVSKATIYRCWPSKFALVAAAIQHGLAITAHAVPLTGDVRDDLIGVMSAKMAALGEGVLGPAIRAVVSEAAQEPELSTALRRMTDQLRDAGPLHGLVVRARHEGLLPPDADIGLTLDLLLGPPFFQLLVLQSPPDPRQAPALVDRILALRPRIA